MTTMGAITLSISLNSGHQRERETDRQTDRQRERERERERENQSGVVFFSQYPVVLYIKKL